VAEVRVGVGYDSHRFGPGGPLVLGGVSIPVEYSLIGHSDGDAVAHALIDALLGAAALGDVGAMFPDDDPANRGANSIVMLEGAVARLHEHGWRVVNVDISVVCETPRLAEYRSAMRAHLAEALGVTMADVSVKGKTNERMGWIGRGEGLACIAVVIISREEPARVSPT
jgi:2-C-methyl-D-erythritol 2,4-cyclodiphosphate synthase